MKKNIGAIILAAGNSRRMGECKFLLLMENGMSFIENIIQTFIDFKITNIVIVTQKNFEKTLNDLFLKNDSIPKVIINSHPEYERFYSVQLGVSSLPDCEYSFIHNADSPFMDIESLELLESNKQYADSVSPVYKDSGGHPVLINKKAMNQILLSPTDSILKDILQNLSRIKVHVRNELITVDIDTPEDYRKHFN